MNDRYDVANCENVKAFVEYSCVRCEGERGFFEVEDGNFYRIAPDIGKCSCGEFEVYSNEFISCEECENAFWHRIHGWSEHLRILTRGLK